MASPFAAFRKYQAAMLAVFGVLIIVVFTIGDSVSRMATDRGDQQDEVVVTWDGMELRQSRLYGLQSDRITTNYLLQMVQNAAMRKGAFPDFQQYAAFMQQIAPDTPLSRPNMIFDGGDLTPIGTVRSIVLAQRARDMQLVIPDKQVQDYLEDAVADGKLKYPEIKKIMEEGQSGKQQRYMKHFFDVIRVEMLADRLRQEKIDSGTFGMPGAQQLDYYSRSNRQIEAEIISIPVADFISEVADPSEAELTEYFEKYQSQTPVFDSIGGVAYKSPEPGFKLPDRVSVEYVKINRNDVLDEVRETITDEEIEAYYEENKKRDLRMRATDDLALPDEESTPADDADAKGVDAGGAEPGDGATNGDTNDVGEDADDNSQESTDAEVPKDDGIRPAESAPKPETGDVEEKRSAPVVPDSSSIRPPAARYFTVSLDGDADGDAATDASGDADGEAKGKADADASSGPADAASESPTESSAGDSGTTNVTSADDVEAEQKPPSAGTVEEPKYKPLDEVKDDIRQSIAEDKANALINKRFAGMRGRMDSFYKANRFLDKGQKPIIERPDFMKEAKKNGLVGHALELKSAWYYQRETDIGKSYRINQGTGFNNRTTRTPFVSFVFEQGEQSWWVARETIDDENNRYLSWKTGEAVTEVRKLENGDRKEVIQAWKTGAGLDDDTGKARDLARKRAEQIAASVRGGVSFEDAAKQQAGSRIVKTESFSWLTEGSAPQASLMAPPSLRLNEIGGIDQAGSDFMQTAFGLKIGEVGVAMNHPQTHVYVIRATFQNKGDEVIQQEFLEGLGDNRVSRQIESAASLDQQLVMKRWFDEVGREMNLVWLRPEARFNR